MRFPRKYCAAFLAIWMVLFIPLVTSSHHHPVVLSGAGDETVSPMREGSRSAPENPPCDLCLRLVIPAEVIHFVEILPLSMSDEIGFIDNDLHRSPHLFSHIRERAPPLMVG
jgi:hypothetical protein